MLNYENNNISILYIIFYIISDFHFSLENSSNLKINKILKHLSTDNKNSTILDYCEVSYFIEIVNLDKYYYIFNIYRSILIWTVTKL